MSLRTRNGNDYTGHYSRVTQDLTASTGSETVVDDEMAAVNDRGLPVEMRCGCPGTIIGNTLEVVIS